MTSKITIIGTWNVRSLSRCGNTDTLSRELDNYKWDIIKLAETRWKGTGEEITDNGHIFLYSGKINKTEWC